MNRSETNGLMPEVVRRWKRYPAYKDSGVQWLGKVPAHWTLKPLKRACAINKDVLSEDTPADYEIAYVDIGNVDSLGNLLSEQTMRFENAPSRARRRVRHGDTIISTVRTYLRAIAFMEAPPENRVVSTGFAVLRPSTGIEPRFLWRVVQSSEFVDAVFSHSEGIGYLWEQTWSRDSVLDLIQNFTQVVEEEDDKVTRPTYYCTLQHKPGPWEPPPGPPSGGLRYCQGRFAPNHHVVFLLLERLLLNLEGGGLCQGQTDSCLSF
jgi:hypothetical protein